MIKFYTNSAVRMDKHIFPTVQKISKNLEIPHLIFIRNVINFFLSTLKILFGINFKKKYSEKWK